MKNLKLEYCKKTKKYIFSSEAKAIRSVNKYRDIKRAYFCEHCEGWHTTSKESFFPIKEKSKDIALKIKKRIVYLTNKLKKDDKEK